MRPGKRQAKAAQELTLRAIVAYEKKAGVPSPELFQVAQTYALLAIWEALTAGKGNPPAGDPLPPSEP